MDISSEGIDKVFAMAIGIRQVLLTRAEILKMVMNVPLCMDSIVPVVYSPSDIFHTLFFYALYHFH